MSKKFFGKALKVVGVVAGIAAAAVTGGASLGISAALLSGISTVAALGSSLLAGKPRAPQASPADRDRLIANIDTRAPRKIVYGRTAMATDIRDQEFSGSNQEFFHRFVVCAAHKVGSIDEIWFDDKLAWTIGGGVQGEFVGYLTVDVRTEGSAANAINIGPRMGSTRRYTGLAYVHFRYKLTGNSKSSESPFSQAIPTRVTIVGDAMPIYDPRLDTAYGGVGSHSATDQNTWDWGANTYRNPALQLLNYLLGWRINGKISVGKGIPIERIDVQSFIDAANLCDEAVSLAAGGTEPRYRTDGIFSERDPMNLVTDQYKSSMNATLDDVDGRIRLQVLYNDLAIPVASFTEDDILGQVDWRPQIKLPDQFNIIRGTFTDPSNNSLYQSVTYPEVEIANQDGIDRIETINYPLVQSASQCQRLAKQRLQRMQFGGTFIAEYQATAWKVQKGDVIEQTFPALGFTNKLFRVVDTDVKLNGVVSMFLREEDAALYLWDQEEAPAVVPAPPDTYDYTLNPIYQDVLSPSFSDGQAIDEFRGAIQSISAGLDFVVDDFAYPDEAALVSNWERTNGGGSFSASGTDPNVPGGKFVRFGDNSGNDEWWASWREPIPFDPEALYEVEFVVRRVTGSGQIFLGLTGYEADKTTPVSGSGATSTTNAHYVAANGEEPALGVWTRYVGYVKGHAATGITSARPNPGSPAAMQENVRYIAPVVLLGFQDQAGENDVAFVRLRKLDIAPTIVDQAPTATNSDFSAITGSTKPQDNATIGADWSSNLVNRPPDADLLNNQQLWAEVGGAGRPQDNADVTATNISLGIFGQSDFATFVDPFATTALLQAISSGRDLAVDDFSYSSTTELEANWNQTNAGGSFASSGTDPDVPGGKFVRFGDNSGNDEWWAHKREPIPFDPEALYEVEFVVRRVTGSGQIFLGLQGFAENRSTPYSRTGAVSFTNTHYVAANAAAPALGVWTRYVGYVKGFASTGTGSPRPDPTFPGQMYELVRYITPMILVNFADAAGEIDVAYARLRRIDSLLNLSQLRSRNLTELGRAEESFVSSGDGRNFAKLVASGQAADGDVIAFGQSYGSIPTIVFGPGGSGPAEGAEVQVRADNLTVSGFDMTALEVDLVPGTVRTDTGSVAGAGGEPDRVMEKGTNSEPWNGLYTYQVNVTVPEIAPGEPGNIQLAFFARQSGVWTQVGSASYSNGGVKNKPITPGAIAQTADQEYGVSVVSATFGASLVAFAQVTYTEGAVTETSLTSNTDIPWSAYLEQ